MCQIYPCYVSDQVFPVVKMEKNSCMLLQLTSSKGHSSEHENVAL